MTDAPAPAALEQPVRFSNLDSPTLLHGISTRHGGVSQPPFASLNLSVKVEDDPEHVEQNRRRFEALMGIETRQVAFGRLTHGSDVALFKVGALIPELAPPDLGWPMFDCDAAISDVPGLALVMTFADCVPVMLWDPTTCACALIHAGWKGTALRICSKTIEAMTKAFGTDPSDLRAGIGPSISQERYPVGADVIDSFRAAYGSDSSQFLHGANLDLWAANSYDLESAGMVPANIEVSGICTAGNTDRFFSHRGENGRTGRFGGCIGIRYAGRFGMPA